MVDVRVAIGLLKRWWILARAVKRIPTASTAILVRLQSPGCLSSPIVSAKMAGIKKMSPQMNRTNETGKAFFMMDEYIMKIMHGVMV